MSDWYGSLQAEVCDRILPYAKEQGAKVFGCVGTCWGGYLVARLSAYSDFRAAVSFHPATTFIAENVNKEKLYEVRPAIYFHRMDRLQKSKGISAVKLTQSFIFVNF